MKKLIKTKDHGVQNYMFLQKIKQSLASHAGNYIWVINLMLFITVVFLGIEQAERGASISNLEDKIESQIETKRQLSEQIFSLNADDKLVSDGHLLGFIKPSEVLYFNSEDVSLSLR